MSKQNPIFASIILSLAGLTACSHQPAEPIEPPLAEDQSTPEIEAPPAPFAQDTLYALLVAELAGRRGNVEVALNNYLEQAQQTRDLGLVKRATQIARQLRSPKAALEASSLWVELEPENQEALFIATTEQINAGRFLDALENSLRLEKLGNQALHLTIASRAAANNHASVPLLVERIALALEDHSAPVELITAQAILLQRDMPEDSLALAQKAQTLDPSYVTAAVVEVKVLQQLNRNEQALTRIEELLKEHPNNKRLRLQYARLLANTNLAAAETEFATLHQQYPKDNELQLAYSLVLYELQKLDQAEEQFNTLLDNDGSSSMANYYLGRIAMNRKQPNVALGYFNEVKLGGPNFLPAWVFRSDILAEQGQLEAAIELMKTSSDKFPKMAQRFLMVTVESLNKYDYVQKSIELLNQALEQAPENRNLIYARAMSYEKLDMIDAMEADLRSILSKYPDDAAILNALGYTLATRSDRFDEAFELIHNAYRLKPEDPAIIDSIGWVEYLRGNLEPALGYLRQAMAAYPDHEIAAHLGEVLWQLERQEEAQKIWQQGLQLNPNSPIINEAIKRLKKAPK